MHILRLPLIHDDRHSFLHYRDPSGAGEEYPTLRDLLRETARLSKASGENR